MVKMVYQGSINFSNKETVVVLDETNNMVNFFVKNLEFKDVECHQFQKDFINTFSGDTLMARAATCWMSILSNIKIAEENGFLQTFPLSFWDDIVVPMTKGCDLDKKFRVEAIEQVENI